MKFSLTLFCNVNDHVFLQLCNPLSCLQRAPHLRCQYRGVSVDADTIFADTRKIILQRR